MVLKSKHWKFSNEKNVNNNYLNQNMAVYACFSG